jgi:hypothetical protein
VCCRFAGSGGDRATLVRAAYSPLLANIALNFLDEKFAEDWDRLMSTVIRRRIRRRKGLGTWRLVRYTDDFVVMVAGTRANAQALQAVVADRLAPMGRRLSAAKTKIVHIDEDFDFLGWHVQRKRKRGTNQVYVYTYPSKKALRAITASVRTLTERTSQPNLPGRAGPRQRSPAGLGQLLQARSVQAHVQLPDPDHAPGCQRAA